MSSVVETKQLLKPDELISTHSKLKGCFKVKIGPETLVYSALGQIPDVFDNLICFKPDPIPPPHMEADHRLMEKYPAIQQALLSRGRKDASSNTNR